MLDKILARAQEVLQKLDRMSPDVAAQREQKANPPHVRNIESRLESPPQTKGNITTEKGESTGETDSEDNCKNKDKENGIKRDNERPGATLEKSSQGHRKSI